jgi:hypothetical protein
MAIHRESREDLMREATAYARRLRGTHPQTKQPVVVGLRPQGGWSVYFGEDPVYQFNAAGRLRRAHFAERNYAAEEGRLLLLARDRVGGRVELQKIYSADTERRILSDCLERLKGLAEWIRAVRVEEVEIFPAGDPELIKAVAELSLAAAKDLQIARASNA